jgi:hypothetical protein
VRNLKLLIDVLSESGNHQFSGKKKSSKNSRLGLRRDRFIKARNQSFDFRDPKVAVELLGNFPFSSPSEQAAKSRFGTVRERRAGKKRAPTVDIFSDHSLSAFSVNEASDIVASPRPRRIHHKSKNSSESDEKEKNQPQCIVLLLYSVLS